MKKRRQMCIRDRRKVVYDQYFEKEKDIVTGIVQRYVGKNVSINLGKADAMLTENEQVKGEVFKPTERIKLYVVEVKNTTKGPKILVSRTHPELVKRLFESEVTEVKDGIVEIKSIAREAGSRSKIAVWSNDPDVDPVGACVGMNGARVNAIVQEPVSYTHLVDVATYERNKEAADNENKYIVHCLNTGKLCIFTAEGKMHQIKVLDLPFGKFRDKGLPIDNVSNYDSTKEELIYICDGEQLRYAKLLFATCLLYTSRCV